VSLFLVIAAFAAFAPKSRAASAENGYFHFGATRFEITDSLAYSSEPTSSAPASTVVVFTDFAIDRDELLKAINPTDALFGQIAKQQRGNLVVVTLRSPDRCEVYAFLGESSQQLGLGDEFPATTTGSSASRAKGVCATEKPGQSFDDSYDFRLPFDLALTAIPKPERLPSGGGEPGRALAALVKAIQEKDFPTARLHLRTVEVPGTPPPQSALKEFFDGLALNYPRSVTVNGGLIKGDRAQVEMKGTDREGKKLKGTFTMKKTAGNWRVVEQYLYFDE
jgi:hypothetical protein